MFDFTTIEVTDKEQLYDQINVYLKGLVSEESDWLAGISNSCALLYQMIPNLNWAGFYLWKENQLVLGPFQGKPACFRINFGKGVCGTAAKERKVQVVEDVEMFPGHIACDSESRSEIVVPIIKDDRLIGVLDIDSPNKANFDEVDAKGLIAFVDALIKYLEWPDYFV